MFLNLRISNTLILAPLSKYTPYNLYTLEYDTSNMLKVSQDVTFNNKYNFNS